MVLAIQLVHIAGFADAPRLVYLLRFDLVRDPSELAPLEIMVRPPGALAWLADRGILRSPELDVSGARDRGRASSRH